MNKIKLGLISPGKLPSKPGKHGNHYHDSWILISEITKNQKIKEEKSKKNFNFV